MSERFDAIRAEIVGNDHAIVSAVNHRLALVTELWRLKGELGLDTVDPDRERRLNEALVAANAGPLSEDGVERLVAELLALTKRELGAS